MLGSFETAVGKLCSSCHWSVPDVYIYFSYSLNATYLFILSNSSLNSLSRKKALSHGLRSFYIMLKGSWRSSSWKGIYEETTSLSQVRINLTLSMCKKHFKTKRKTKWKHAILWMSPYCPLDCSSLCAFCIDCMDPMVAAPPFSIAKLLCHCDHCLVNFNVAAFNLSKRICGGHI